MATHRIVAPQTLVRFREGRVIPHWRNGSAEVCRTSRGGSIPPCGSAVWSSGQDSWLSISRLGFNSRYRNSSGDVAQMAERSLSKREVGGSIPPFSIVQLAQMAERGALDSVAAGSIPALDPSHCSCGANGSAPGYELGGCRFESCHGPCTMTVDLMGMVPQPVS